MPYWPLLPYFSSHFFFPSLTSSPFFLIYSYLLSLFLCFYLNVLYCSVFYLSVIYSALLYSQFKYYVCSFYSDLLPPTPPPLYLFSPLSCNFFFSPLSFILATVLALYKDRSAQWGCQTPVTDLPHWTIMFLFLDSLLYCINIAFQLQWITNFSGSLPSQTSVYAYDIMEGWGPVSLSPDILFPYPEKMEQYLKITSYHSPQVLH